jgi:hypothetical protein
VRIFDTASRASTSLRHNWPIVGAAWMEQDAALLTLGANGVVGKWSRLAPAAGASQWAWAQAFLAGQAQGPAAPAAIAYDRGRVAIAFPQDSVKIWEWSRTVGWQELRCIKRSQVSAIRFVNDGAGLLGGTTDGVL